jgi:hypothetical protein
MIREEMRMDDWDDDAGSDVGYRLEDLIVLHGATNAEELRRALIAPPATHAGARGSSTFAI